MHMSRGSPERTQATGGKPGQQDTGGWTSMREHIITGRWSRAKENPQTGPVQIPKKPEAVKWVSRKQGPPLQRDTEVAHFLQTRPLIS